ncbi:hypothetical protein IB67_02465 [Fervidobacterium riparium]|nr:hypothetical protein IB67_02465 [Fervidobacterium riparium]
MNHKNRFFIYGFLIFLIFSQRIRVLILFPEIFYKFYPLFFHNANLGGYYLNKTPQNILSFFSEPIQIQLFFVLVIFLRSFLFYFLFLLFFELLTISKYTSLVFLKKLGTKRNLILFSIYLLFITTLIYFVDNSPRDNVYLFGIKISNSLSWLIITCLIYFISAYFEELTYRDIVFNVVKKQMGTLSGVLLSSLLFSFRHFPVYMLFYKDTLITSLIFVFLVAIFLSITYIFSGNNIFVPTVIHTLWNFTSNFYTTKYFIQLNIVFVIIFVSVHFLIKKHIKILSVF